MTKYGSRKLLAGVLMLSMIFSLLAVAAAPVLGEDDDDVNRIVLTVKGDGVAQTVQFTMAQLEALGTETHTYSGYNFYPSLKVFENTTGVPLEKILTEAGLENDATIINIRSGNDTYSAYTIKDLLKSDRYYYPIGENTNDCSVWPPIGRGSTDGAVKVPTMIAFEANGDLTGGKLIYGQQTPLEPICCNGEQLAGLLDRGCTIEVTKDNLEYWGEPDAYPNSGTVISGTEVKLQYGDGKKLHTKIYYTLDGTEPSVWSNIYNISYPNFRPWFNKPIPITGEDEITIKTRAIGLGKLDGPVVTYNYNLGTLACRVRGAGIKADYAVETLQEMTPVQGTYQCIDNGQTVGLNGEGVLLDTLLDEAGAAKNWEVEFITAEGKEYAAGTVQNLKDQQCMLAYKVNGNPVSDQSSGGETVTIQILRNLNGEDLSDNRIKYVNYIKLINVDDVVRIDDVRLLDYNGEPINSVARGGGYCIEVDAANGVEDTAKDALMIIQVRCGEDADSFKGGKVLAYMASQTVINAEGGKYRAEFTLPNYAWHKAYVDVFVWDNIHDRNPLGSENQTLSFFIE